MRVTSETTFALSWFRYPGVKKGEERLRVNVTRGHTREDMDMALDLLDSYGQAFFVQSGEELGEMVTDS